MTAERLEPGTTVRMAMRKMTKKSGISMRMETWWPAKSCVASTINVSRKEASIEVEAEGEGEQVGGGEAPATTEGL